MHSMIVFACLIAVAAAGGLPGLGGIPVGPGVAITGVADTPEVSIAKAQHFAAHAAARGHGHVIAAPAVYSAAAPIVHHHGVAAVHHAAPVVHHAAPLVHHAAPIVQHHGYAASVVTAGAPLGGIPVGPGVSITGVADTPAVVAAKHQHFAAHAAARSGIVPIAGIPTAHGTITNVADTPEVVHAKAQHFAAHAAARGHVIAAPAVYSAAAVHHGFAAVHHAAPVISHHHGVPLAGIPTAHGVITGVAETPEVVHAKAQHFAAHAQALARNG